MCALNDEVLYMYGLENSQAGFILLRSGAFSNEDMLLEVCFY